MNNFLAPHFKPIRDWWYFALSPMSEEKKIVSTVNVTFINTQHILYTFDSLFVNIKQLNTCIWAAY